jgi:hypothetical protein
MYALSSTFAPPFSSRSEGSNAPTSLVVGEGLFISDLFEHPGDCPRKEGEILFNDVPDTQGIDAEILMHEDIPKSGDPMPVDLRMVCLQVSVKALRGFSENLEISEDSILYHLISKNASFPPRVYLAIRSVHSLMWSR